MSLMAPRRIGCCTAAIALLLTVTGCGGAGSGNKAAAGKAGAGRGPIEVGFVTVQPTSAPIVADLSGRTAAYESSDVRPQVTGLIRRRFFTEGTMVRAGQPLYEIDPSLYRAAVNQAQANLQSAQATAEAAQVQAQRYAPLAKIEAVSKQDYTNAVASARQGRASVAQTKAALDTARVNLRFTTVPAPITGRIGRSLFTVGALVSASQTDPLAQIQRLDPMFVDIQQSAADLLTLRRQLATNGVAPTRAAVHLTLPDGSEYPGAGSVQFAEAVVNAETGTVTLRARFPNAQGVLLPGMFVRARFAQAIDSRVFLVPEQAVTRDAKGNASVLVVGADNKAATRQIKASQVQGANWVVTGGLNAGDRIITQGTGKVQPGQAVRAVPANTPQRVEVPQQGKAAAGAGKAG